MKTLYTTIISELAKKEGKKKQTSVGQVREVVKILSKMVFKNPDILKEILRLGSKK